jgi:hypothetical protein
VSTSPTSVVPTAPCWWGVDVHCSAGSDSLLRLLRLRVLSEKGETLREAMVPGDASCSSPWVEIRFAPILNAPERPFTLEISSARARREEDILVREERSGRGSRLACRLRCGEPREPTGRSGP